MANSKIKRPQPGRGKDIAPAVSITPPPQQRHPVFCPRYLRKGYGLAECDREEKAALIETLGRLAQLTWSEISAAPRHGMGYEKMSRDAIKGDIFPDFITEDVTIIALRFSGMKPMVGFRDGIIFRIVWLDRDFTLYEH